jgi:peptidoglycan/xylan/chitin deacetylase (PgdA/CDA1 family)
MLIGENMSFMQKIITPIATIANHTLFLDVYSFYRRKKTGSQIAILMYHRIAPENDSWLKNNRSTKPLNPKIFDAQLSYISKNYEILSLEKLTQYIRERKPLPKKAIVVTFDDGYKDNYLYAYPILKKYNIPSTVFLPTGHIGTGKLLWWDEIAYYIHYTSLDNLKLDNLGTYVLNSSQERLYAIDKICEELAHIPEEKKSYIIREISKKAKVRVPADLGDKRLTLNWEEIREMDNNGVSFGAHGVNHAILTNLPFDKAKDEIITSKKEIEEKIGKKVTAFSYPNGNYNQHIIEFLENNGFSCAVGVQGKLVSLQASIFELPRLIAFENFNTFKLMLSGLLSDLIEIKAKLKAKR